MWKKTALAKGRCEVRGREAAAPPCCWVRSKPHRPLSFPLCGGRGHSCIISFDATRPLSVPSPNPTSAQPFSHPVTCVCPVPVLSSPLFRVLRHRSDCVHSRFPSPRDSVFQQCAVDFCYADLTIWLFPALYGQCRCLQSSLSKDLVVPVLSCFPRLSPVCLALQKRFSLCF